LVIVSDSGDNTVLVITAGARNFAIPVRHVCEILRPQAIEAVVGMPDYVLGLCIVRGTLIPVVDLQALSGGRSEGINHGRLVILKLGDRRLALGVESVEGLRKLPAAAFDALPSLLGDGAVELVESVGLRDTQLLFVLRASRIVPEEVWTAVAAAGASA
jgi:purine-binding chemotaxis protein CheW